MISLFFIFLAFAFIHSISATVWFKQLCLRRCGGVFMRVWYRFLFSFVSAVTAAVAYSSIARVPDRFLWEAPSPVRWGMHALQVGALIFGVQAFKYLDGLEFLGIKQVRRYLTGREAAGDLEGMSRQGLVTSGVYGVVRHPLYFAGIILLTCNPVVTSNSLAVTVLADAYFLFGAFMEEKRFLRYFGDQYRQYMKRVPRLLPCPLRRSNPAS